MTPAARAQAAVELLDEILAAARSGGAAADTLIARYFKTRRYAGSKDRRAVRELVYRAIRRAGDLPESGRAAMVGLARADTEIAAAFDGSPHGPSPIAEGEAGAEAGLIPTWLKSRLDPLVAEAEWPALLERAPLDLRINRLRDEIAARAAFPDAAPTPHAPLGLRLDPPRAVEADAAWRSGLVEVQDEGSQLLAAGCGAQGGMTVIDLCAGAGGKTLALAADMGNAGQILACDTDRGRLANMAPRLARAGVAIVTPRLLDPGREAVALADQAGQADIVLVDAPCSGSGTWRRNPETRWRLTPDRLARLTALQAHLLDVAAPLVKPGGLLVYAICSLLAEEGREQAASFSSRLASRHSGWRAQTWPFTAGRAAGSDGSAGRLLTPAYDRTDGFFVAMWRAP